MLRDIGLTALGHLEHLCLQIGPRPIGSRGNLAAADYVRRVLQDRGLAVALQEFSCPLWEERETRVELDGSDLRRGAPDSPLVTANDFSHPCDVTARTVALGTLAELEQADLSGRIGLLCGELTTGTGIGARSAVYFPEHHQRIIQVLERKRPAALITIHAKIGSLERLIRDPDFAIPSATVPAEVGLTLLRHADRPVHLTIDSHRTPARFSNVVATRSGRRSTRIALLAHFDTTNNTPGAVDNASGVAVLLALAELFAHKDLSVSLEWLVVNGEENGGLGAAAYLHEREDTMDQTLAVINVDGVGQRVGANTITVMGASQPFQDQVRALHQAYPGVIWAAPWYESDHSAFLWRGVPCVPLSSVGVANIGHLPADKAEWISPAKLGEVVSLVADVIHALRDRSPAWCREPRSE
ncbi:MAG: M28 family peptidase [Anaerolineae bacterium]|jgi:Iap family predicted aminopeptidase